MKQPSLLSWMRWWYKNKGRTDTCYIWMNPENIRLSKRSQMQKAT